MYLRRLICAGALMLGACAGGHGSLQGISAQKPDTRPALRYTVAPDPVRQQLRVRLCFEGRVPSRLIYGTRAAADFLLDPEWVAADGRRTPVPVHDGLLLLPPARAGDCVAYGVDVRAALERDSLLLAYPGEHSWVLAAELFLWRPQVRSPELQSTLRFVLPHGQRVSAPWRQVAGEPGVYVLDERAFAFTGHVVLGEFDTPSVSAPGTQLRVAILRGFPASSAALIGPWLERAARVASLPGAVFPVPNAQVIVVPTSPSAFPIYFGHTGRSGGASIVLFVPTDVDASRLRDDWIAVHEFSHLWHPFVQRQDAWLSEGIATYLQEVLRARAGLIRGAEVWQSLYEGAQLGRESSRSLVEETRRMPYERNYHRVYWSGAAIALMMDVKLRTASHGRLSLDVLLARLRKEPKWYMRPHSASQILHELDRLAHLSVCEAVARRHLQGALPDLTPLFARLGVVLEPQTTSPSRSAAPLAWVRDAIIATASDLATARPLGGG